MPILDLQDSRPVYYQSQRFSQACPKQVFHGFFGRAGGVSKDVYASLNCGPGSNDDSAHVLKNREIVCNEIGVHKSALLSLYQMHGTSCVRVEAVWPQRSRPHADSMVTDKQGIALGILTADCAPVLFYGEGKDGPVIGAAHAGWRGALSGVLEETVSAMNAYGVQPDGIAAVIGPCIQQESYEISRELFEKFIEADESYGQFFAPGENPDKKLFDLPGFCAFRLGQCGVQDVYIKALDTCFNEEDFFSYRRATHRKEKDYGRNISVIVINQ